MRLPIVAASALCAALLATLLSACGGGGGPSEREIVDSLDQTLQSVAGNWTGIATPPGTAQLAFTLQEGANGQLTGTGTFKESSTALAVPVSITGSFARPALKLAFTGIVSEGVAVDGVAQGSYTTVGGVSTTLKLSAPGYARDIAFLLQEQ